jgi:uncharacterized membrane protein
MNKFVAAFLCTALAVSGGCQQNKSAPGGPGAPGGKGPAVKGTNPKEDTFTISTPSGTTDIKQGQTKEVTITVDRGKQFKQDVKLELSSDTPGLTIKPTTAELKASETNTALKFTLDAAKTAAVGEHKVTVKATPTSGAATEESFNVKISS